MGEHPSVWLAPYKEVHFFDREGKSEYISDWEHKRLGREIRRKTRSLGEDAPYVKYLERLNTFTSRTLDWYEGVYSWQTPPGVLRGEVTPSYLDLPAERVAYAREILGPTKIILIIRDPYERELSQLRMKAARLANKKGRVFDSEAAWQQLYKEMKWRGPRGNYEAGIANWEEHFGTDSMLIMPFGDIRNRPEEFIKRVEAFLGLQHFDNYEKIREQIHSTQKLEIPQHVKDLALAHTAPEVDYLRSRFDDDFMASIR